MPSGYLADRWNRTKAMAVTIVAWSIISAVGGLVPTSAFVLLVIIRGTLGFGQAITDPSGSSVIADFYGIEKRGKAFSIQQCLNYVGLGVGPGHRRRARSRCSTARAGASPSSSPSSPDSLVAWMCWRLPEPSRGTADRAHVTHSDEMEVSDQTARAVVPSRA